MNERSFTPYKVQSKNRLYMSTFDSRKSVGEKRRLIVDDAICLDKN